MKLIFNEPVLSEGNPVLVFMLDLVLEAGFYVIADLSREPRSDLIETVELRQNLVLFVLKPSPAEIGLPLVKHTGGEKTQRIGIEENPGCYQTAHVHPLIFVSKSYKWCWE